MNPVAARAGEARQDEVPPHWSQQGEIRQWGLSLGVVLAMHASILVGFVLWLRPHATPPVPSPPPAVMVDLAPAPAPPPAPTPQPPSPQPPSPQPPPPVAAPRPPQPVTPAPLSAPTAAASLPAEPARPQPAPPSPPVPRPPPATPAPPTPSPPPSRALPTWQGQVLGQLQRLKHYPEAALFHHQQGVVWLRFAINREGRVLSASIDKSSGVDSLDAEALALVRRAQPLPRPPADVPGERLELVAPIEFHLSQRR